MNDPTLTSLRGFAASFASAPEARLVELGDVQATVSPHVPERSLFNCVVYDDAASLERHYDELASAFDGVDAWTVWVHDEAAAELLAARGHALDADPANMLLGLAEVDGPPFACEAGTMAELAAVNEAAYPWHDGSMQRGIEALEPYDHVYVVRRDGRAVAALAIEDVDADAYVTLVATLPEARGGGLATGLMRQALLDAKKRGQATSTLQATKKGEPVYARLGYRTLGSLQMWERRRS